MNVNTIKKIFKKNELWVEECPAVPQTGIPLTYAFIRQNKHLGKICQNVVFMLYVDDYIYEITLVKEKNNVFEQLKHNLKEDKNWLDNKIKEWKSLTAALNKIVAKTHGAGLSKFSNKELAVLYKNLVDSLADSWSYSIMGEGCDPFSTHKLISSIMAELDVTENIARDIALTLTKAKIKSFLDDEKLSLLNLVLLKKLNSKQFAKKLDLHVKNYFWIKNNYLDTKILDENYFLPEIDVFCQLSTEEVKKKISELKNYESIIKKEKQAIYRKYSKGKHRFSHDLKLSICILETMSWWIDQRKIVMLKSFDAIFKILEEICVRFNDQSYSLPYLKYATDFEIINLLTENKIIGKKSLEQRRRFGLHAMDAKEQWTYFSGKDAQEIHAVFMQKFAAKEIRGLTASLGNSSTNVAGIIIGHVSVVSNVDKDHFNPGSILVTSMTRPEFVPLMRKAKAIVTDEGGITCHAAIVSRELGIPCIIGTRVATKVLKTGDKIEMDIREGIVRKI